MDLERLPFERSENGIVTLWLYQSDRPVVVLDSALLRSIDATLDEIGTDLNGFVLASRSRVFVAGANLAEIMELSDAELDEYLQFGSRVYGRIATLPCTTVAALNGAALGGGLEIAMHCDHLIAARPQPKEPGGPVKPYLVGLPEAGLSICPGWGGTCLLPARMDAARAMALTAEGRPMSVFDAAECGLIERMIEPDDLISEAVALAATPKAAARTEPVSIAEASRRKDAECGLENATLPDSQSGHAVRACVEAGMNDGWQACLAAERSHLIRLRNTEEGRGAITAFFEKSGGKA